MELSLQRGDLLEESQEKPCSLIGFEDFGSKVQEAIRSVGRAVIRDYSTGYENYNAVYPPKET